MATHITATLVTTTGPVVLLLVMCVLLIAAITAGLAVLCRPVDRTGAASEHPQQGRRITTSDERPPQAAQLEAVPPASTSSGSGAVVRLS
jgi:hypothetical protein